MLFNIQKKFLLIPTIMSLIFSVDAHAKKSAALEEDINLDTSHKVGSKLTKISSTQNMHNSKQVMLKVKIGEVKKEMTSVFFIPFEKSMDRVFAETTLVALSGNTAFFQSGGEIPIVSPNGIEYKSYGLKISFTPTVSSSSRINMEIYSEVSELSKNSSIRSYGTKMPSIESRKAKTTIELGHGESFMIAGLVKDLVSLRSRDNTEVVISVTPYIVHSTKDENITFPTDKYYKHNNMEIKFIENLNKNSGIRSDLSPAGPSGLIVE